METDIVDVVGAGLAGCECACPACRPRRARASARDAAPDPVARAPYGPYGRARMLQLVQVDARRFRCGSAQERVEANGFRARIVRRARPVPAGGALAVDRDEFSRFVEREVSSRPGIEVVRGEVTGIPDGHVVIAAGPLLSRALSARPRACRRGGALLLRCRGPHRGRRVPGSVRPVCQSRYGEEGTGDYLNAPLDREEYTAFIDALVSADRVVLKDFESGESVPGVHPAEEVARKGPDAIRFGAMKPVGLTDPRTGRRPWAARSASVRRTRTVRRTTSWGSRRTLRSASSAACSA